MSRPSPADPSGSYKIFISYRRDDAQATVDHIYDWLVRAFASSLGPKAIFKDVDSIPSGFGFPGVVNSAMRQCRVVLIVIGPSWTTLLSDKEPYKGQPRLNDPADNVRVEVEYALALAPTNDGGHPASDLLLIPVLVQGARMPHAEQLPASLRPLAERNGTKIRPDPDFAHDTRRLINRMAEWIGVTADDPNGGRQLPNNTAPPSKHRSHHSAAARRPLRIIADFFAYARTLFLRFATSLVSIIKSIWSRDDLVARRKVAIKNATLKETERRSSTLQRPLTSEEIQLIQEQITQEYAGVLAPSIGMLTHAWVRRITYLLLVIVIVVSYFVLVTARASILFGGSSETPPFLQALFQYLQVITGLLFVSIAALSGMLIQEYSGDLPDVVKIEPYIVPAGAKTKLGLAIALFVLDVVFVAFLTLGGILQQYQQSPDAQAINIVVSGLSILVAGNALLAWAGIYQAAKGLVSLVLDGSIALICVILATICWAAVALVLLLDFTTGWLWNLLVARGAR